MQAAEKLTVTTIWLSADRKARVVMSSGKSIEPFYTVQTARNINAWRNSLITNSRDSAIDEAQAVH